ncbi:MAG TPA: N-acetylmuramoyl-L-alanine amidase-like domain-containing protein, partial [Bacteroidota bacterium]
MNRRLFLRYSAAGFSAIPVWKTLALDQDEIDSEICARKFELAVSLSLRDRPINEAIARMGLSFLGTEYLAHALEVPGPERLVVNMRGLDCVSFYENAFVLARCVKKNATTFDDYQKELTLVRYRGGVIDGYPSRLHYTSDYFYDGQKKGLWENRTKKFGGVPYVKAINFMSTHPESYRQLKENPELVEVIREQEKEISAREHYFLPKEKVKAAEEYFHSGDILG